MKNRVTLIARTPAPALPPACTPPARRPLVARVITRELIVFTLKLRGGSVFPVLPTTPSNDPWEEEKRG